MAGRIPIHRRVADVLRMRPGKADPGICTSCHRMRPGRFRAELPLAPAAAQTALQALHAHARLGDKDWGLGLEVRSRALLADGGAAEELYTEAIGRLGRTRMRLPLARAHLLYGEWLRRQRRRTDARAQLRTAHDLFEAMGARSFAGRARQELTATGATAHSRRNATLDRAHPARSPHRQPGRRGTVQPRDRRPPVHQQGHRQLPPEQGIPQARHPLPGPAPPRPGTSARAQLKPPTVPWPQASTVIHKT